MADKKIQMTQRNATNDGWDNLFPVTKAANIVRDDGTPDYICTIPYAVATGSANTYAVTLNPVPTSYVDGIAICVKINIASTGASTLNVNGLGAKAIKDSLGNAITSGGLKANTPYTLRYESTSGSFIVQGKGGGGNTIAAHVLAGETCTVDSGPITGTLVSQAAYTAAISAAAQSGRVYLRAPLGAFITPTGSGYPEIYFDDADFKAENIVSGKNLFGLDGAATIQSLGGKRYASGTVTVDSNYHVTVSGLSFKPTVIIITNSTDWMQTYWASMSTSYYYNWLYNGGNPSKGFLDGSTYYVNTGGFCFSGRGVGIVCNWIAIE